MGLLGRSDFVGGVILGLLNYKAGMPYCGAGDLVV